MGETVRMRSSRGIVMGMARRYIMDKTLPFINHQSTDHIDLHPYTTLSTLPLGTYSMYYHLFICRI